MKDRLLEIRHFDPAKYREILLFGGPLIPHSVGIFLLSSADRIVINDRIGVSGVGIYMTAVQVAGILGLLFDAINNAYVPWLYEKLQNNSHIENIEIVHKTYRWFSFLLAISAVSFVIGPTAFNLLVDDRYHAAANLVGWLVLGHCFNGMYLMVTNYIFYSKRTGMLSLVTIFSGGGNIALMIFLIPSLGLDGVVISFALAMCLRFLLTWWVAQRRHPMPWFYFKGSISC
jgi:O-antigen/teichoic acid export membrane protein